MRIYVRRPGFDEANALDLDAGTTIEQCKSLLLVSTGCRKQVVAQLVECKSMSSAAESVHLVYGGSVLCVRPEEFEPQPSVLCSHVGHPLPPDLVREGI